MADPNVPRRDQLEKLLPSIDLIRQFEKLFEQAGDILPSDIEALQILTQETSTIVSGLVEKQQKVVNITTSYSALVGNYSIIADATSGTITVILPPADEANALSYGITKKDTSSNSVIIQGSGVDTIVGEAQQVLEVDGEVINVISDGIDWELLS